MTEERRIVITEDDLAGDPAATTHAAATPPPPLSATGALPPLARQPPLNMGSTFASPGMAQSRGAANILNDPRTGVLIAALVGMFLAWAISEITNLPSLALHARTETGLEAYVGVWTLVLEVVFVGVIVGFDRIVAGAFSEGLRRAMVAAIPASIVGFIAGFVAQDIYWNLIQNSFNPASGKAYLARAVGWAVFGMGAGVVLGIVDRSGKKALNGAVGGLAGGALGGIIFQFVSLHEQTHVRIARLLGLLAIAALVAIATRAIETARREAWLRVIGGGMTGKEFILYHQTTRLGSDPHCEIFLLKDPAVESLHAQIEDRAGQRLLSASPSAPVLVNSAPTTSRVLRNGDILQIGNTVIAYSERVAPHAA
jgi:hypothetical protein